MTLLAVVLGAAVVLLAVALYLQRREFAKLRRWAEQPRLTDPPEAVGAWGEVFNLLHRHRRTTLRRRRQLAQLIVRTRRAAQALPYGVTVLDSRLRLDWCNAMAHRQFNLDPDRDRGAPIVNIVRYPSFIAFLRSGNYAEPLRLQTGGANPRTFAVQLVAFDLDAWLMLSEDVTQADRLEAMRRDFVANVSHELRTPLTVLSGFLETIQDLKLDRQRVRDYLDLMQPQAERMRRIIDDLLALSALEHAPPPAEARIAIRPLLERLRAETEQLSGGRHRIALGIDGDRDLRGAEREIASAFLNLAGNAVRYTPAGGEIRLEWRADSRGAEFAVSDTGIGIDAAHVPRLTERFYRVDRGRSREAGGTGLGLAIVKHALSRHQATLAIDSVPGKGSTFCARFPAARLLPAVQKVPG